MSAVERLDRPHKFSEANQEPGLSRGGWLNGFDVAPDTGQLTNKAPKVDLTQEVPLTDQCSALKMIGVLQPVTTARHCLAEIGYLRHPVRPHLAASLRGDLNGDKYCYNASEALYPGCSLGAEHALELDYATEEPHARDYTRCAGDSPAVLFHVIQGAAIPRDRL